MGTSASAASESAKAFSSARSVTVTSAPRRASHRAADTPPPKWPSPMIVTRRTSGSMSTSRLINPSADKGTSLPRTSSPDGRNLEQLAADGSPWYIGGFHLPSDNRLGETMGAVRHILLRGVEVHNLKAIDLDIPHRSLVVLCGVSGSGKSSLALDTLYAEGQRRYIESFSAYTRQFLQRLEKPEAERIDGIPPAVAVTGMNTSRSSRSTVGTVTETADYLRLLYAKIGRVVCPRCGHEVHRDSPQSAAEVLGSLSDGTRYMVAFAIRPPEDNDPARLAAGLVEEGFVRAIADGHLVNLTSPPPAPPPTLR